MRFAMIGWVMDVFSQIRRSMSDFCLLLTSPTTIFATVGFIFTLMMAAVVAMVFPLLVRRLSLPVSIEMKQPLNLVFETCQDDLNGVCSFPTATLNLRQYPLFSPSVTYSLTVRLQFAQVETSRRIGLFQNIIRTLDDKGRVLREYSKTAYLKEPSLLRKMTWYAFLPLYLLGYMGDANQLEVPVTFEHVEYDGYAASTLFFQLQNRYAQVEEAELLVMAQFGIVRHILYHYPVTSFCLMWLPTFSFFASLIFLSWGFTISNYRRNSQDASLRSLRSKWNDKIKEDEGISNLSPASSISSLSSLGDTLMSLKTGKTTGGEFIPDNVDEVPECVNTVFGIGGMTEEIHQPRTILADQPLRKRR